MGESTELNFPKGILICPVCAKDLVQPHCDGCNNDYFEFADIPCLFPAGLQQKALWQHQMAIMELQGGEALQALDTVLRGYDVAPKTRERLEISYAAMAESLESIMSLLKGGGLMSQRDERFEGSDVENPTEYYHHILRDWAWDAEPSEHFETHANDANLQRVLNVWRSPEPGSMLVLGAGAGRISWDLHEKLGAKQTIASDINPFLLAFAQRLIKSREPTSLPELYTYPQSGYSYAKRWHMEPPADPSDAHEQWYALGADVWNMPLKESSVDSVVTSWLLDVTGGDVKDLISVIAYLLKPGGCWVNTGPLLYSGGLSFDKKYSFEEILDFADMAGFDLELQSVEEIAHMVSPLNARYHYEQLFSFCMRKREQAKLPPVPSNTSGWLTPGWLVMHHLPVPSMDFECRQGHEFITRVLELVDGERSIHLISQMVQQYVPEGVNAKEAVVAMFGQILEGMAGS